MTDPLKKRILLVDDDPDWLIYLTDILYHPQHSFIIKTAQNGKEALNHIAEVDLVITDIQMPELDGLSLLKEIRQINRKLPVILQTAEWPSDGTIEEALTEWDSADFLPKHETDAKLWPLVVGRLGI